jgi:hypothetical protein
MPRSSLVATVTLAALVGSVASAERTCPVCAKGAVDPVAIKALQQMCDFLAARGQMSIHALTWTDEVIANGQKIQRASAVTMAARRPDRLRVEIVDDRNVRELFYDGKRLTLYAPQMEYYAVVEAPSTLRDLVETTAHRYGIEVPLADLFFWGSDRCGADRITSAIDLGTVKVGELLTEQYAFRQPGVDWQVWIQKDPQALPLRLVITTTDNPTQPQFVANLAWNLAPKESELSFTSPRGARKIKLQFLASRPALERDQPAQPALLVATSAETSVERGGTRTSVNVGPISPPEAATVATVDMLPPSCVSVYQHGYTFERCGSVWYQPQYFGTEVSYVVIGSR